MSFIPHPPTELQKLQAKLLLGTKVVLVKDYSAITGVFLKNSILVVKALPETLLYYYCFEDEESGEGFLKHEFDLVKFSEYFKLVEG